MVFLKDIFYSQVQLVLGCSDIRIKHRKEDVYEFT